MPLTRVSPAVMKVPGFRARAGGMSGERRSAKSEWRNIVARERNGEKRKRKENIIIQNCSEIDRGLPLLSVNRPETRNQLVEKLNCHAKLKLWVI
jgi:hypothetical protein